LKTNLNRGLNAEYKESGIIVQSLCPFWVTTKLVKIGGSGSFEIPNPMTFVKYALKTIKTQPVSNGYPYHNFQVNKKKERKYAYCCI
jgi:short-subunit dehydrogenase